MPSRSLVAAQVCKVFQMYVERLDIDIEVTPWASTHRIGAASTVTGADSSRIDFFRFPFFSPFDPNSLLCDIRRPAFNCACPSRAPSSGLTVCGVSNATLPRMQPKRNGSTLAMRRRGRYFEHGPAVTRQRTAAAHRRAHGRYACALPAVPLVRSPSHPCALVCARLRVR